MRGSSGAGIIEFMFKGPHVCPGQYGEQVLITSIRCSREKLEEARILDVDELGQERKTWAVKHEFER